MIIKKLMIKNLNIDANLNHGYQIPEIPELL